MLNDLLGRVEVKAAIEMTQFHMKKDGIEHTAAIISEQGLCAIAFEGSVENLLFYIQELGKQFVDKTIIITQSSYDKVSDLLYMTDDSTHSLKLEPYDNGMMLEAPISNSSLLKGFNLN